MRILAVRLAKSGRHSSSWLHDFIFPFVVQQMVAQICQSQLGINRKKYLGSGKKEKWLRWEMANKSNRLVIKDPGGGCSGLLSIALRLASKARFRGWKFDIAASCVQGPSDGG